MKVVVIGTVGIDDIQTPHGGVQAVLGGSATYASLAARHFAATTLSSVVGHDFPAAYRRRLEDAGIDLRGLETAAGKTFRWGGRYSTDLNSRETTFVDLNVLKDFNPKVPDHATVGSFVFLGNTDPDIQLRILEQVVDPRFIVVDSMDFWIQGNRPALVDVIQRCSCVVLNDEEIRLFSGQLSLPRAVESIFELGPAAVVVKRGEYGAALAANGEWFFAPGFPLHDVIDPTGAGDTFAGALLGSLAESGALDAAALRRAVVYGSVVASFTVEAFGVERLSALTRAEIDERFASFRRLVAF